MSDKFSKETTLGEVLRANPHTKTVLMGFGMHCFGCPMSQMETIEEAAMVHGIEADLLLEKLNETVVVKEKPAKSAPAPKSGKKKE